MKILFVNNIPFNPIAGGIERVTDVLAKELIKRGHRVYYLCAKIDASRQYLLDYDYPALLYQLPCSGLFENEQNVVFYKKLQKELQIDVVINQRGLGGWINSILSVTSVKLVSVIHSKPDVHITMNLNAVIDGTVPPFVGLKKIVKKVLLPFYKKQKEKEQALEYKSLLYHSDAIVTLSRSYTEMFNNFVGCLHGKIVLAIPNPNTFDVVVDHTIHKEKIICYVGRLNKTEKAPLRLLMIWKKLYEKHTDWRILFVGDGEEKENMIAFVRKNHLRNVFFEGRQSDVAKYYKKASFVCLTSNFEGWGMTLTEGMQYGCVPFTFNNCGAAYDIIDDGINGCLIPAFDLNKYAYRLSELMSDDEKRSKMSVAAIEKVKIFSAEKIVDKWEQLLNSL